MKTIAQFRQRKLDYLRFALQCPERCGNIDQDMTTWLSDMLFIDERFGAWEKERKRLQAQGRYSTLGVAGVMAWHLPRPLRANFQRPVHMEGMSIYAEVFHRLGYLQPERLLAPGAWRTLRDSLQLFRQGDWHAADVASRFGPPSLLINAGGSGPGHRRCPCYASTDLDLGWICFDFEFLLEGYASASRGDDDTPPTIDNLPWHDHPDHAQADPLLRDVRYPAQSFEKGLILTPYAQRIQLNPIGMFPTP